MSPVSLKKIYDDRVWGGGSGIGSDPNVARPYLNFLQNFLVRQRRRTVVDIGCGDWQFLRFIDWKNALYHGIDVVPSVIEANTRQFTRANVRFTAGIRSTTPVDRRWRGFAACLKDVLQHLSNANVNEAAGLDEALQVFADHKTRTPSPTATATTAIRGRWTFAARLSTSATPQDCWALNEKPCSSSSHGSRSVMASRPSASPHSSRGGRSTARYPSANPATPGAARDVASEGSMKVLSVVE
jgi:hypothetical protein